MFESHIEGSRRQEFDLLLADNVNTNYFGGSGREHPS